MAKTKTAFTEQSVEQFISSVDQEQKRHDSFELIKLMSSVTGQPPKMWGPSIIGFGEYFYQYESGHSGNAPILGFSPRKAAISLYIATGNDDQEKFLKTLGKFTMGKACIYIKKLSDINIEVAKDLMTDSINFISKKYQRLS